MDGWVDLVQLPSLGGWAILVIGALFIFRKFVRGDLISRKVHEERLADKDKIIELWKSFGIENANQVSKLTGATTAFEQLFNELQREKANNANRSIAQAAPGGGETPR